MPAPSPSYIVAAPAPPLNVPRPWPYLLDNFPADTLFGILGNLASHAKPKDPDPNPQRVELT